jgi:nitrile hydratase
VKPRVHDLGGKAEYFGPVRSAISEPAFHQRWEGRVLGMFVLFAGTWRNNIDEARDVMEQLGPQRYFSLPYWSRWLSALEVALERHGVVAPGEVDARAAGQAPAASGSRRPTWVRRLYGRVTMPLLFREGPLPRWVGWIYASLYNYRRAAAGPPRFKPGDKVQVRDAEASGHTRRPGYVRGRRGTITRHVAAMVLPDAHAIGKRESGQHLYSVAFDGEELWGPSAEPNVVLQVDLFESYLTPV